MKAIISSALLLFAAYQSIQLSNSAHHPKQIQSTSPERITIDQDIPLIKPNKPSAFSNKPRKLFIPEPWGNIPMGLIQGALLGPIAGKWMTKKKEFVSGEERRFYKNSRSYRYEGELANSRLQTALENVKDLEGPLSKLQGMAQSLSKLSTSDLVNNVAEENKIL